MPCAFGPRRRYLTHGLLTLLPRSRGAPALASPRCAVLFLWMAASSDGTLGSRTPFLLQDQNSHVL